MDISRLKKNDIKVWLPLFDDVEILCRHMPQSEFDAIEKKTTTSRFDSRSHRRREERDDKEFRKLMGRAVVVDWKGLKEGEKDYPCTPDNVDFLMEECTEFRLLVMDAPLSLEKMLAAEKAEAEKNS